MISVKAVCRVLPLSLLIGCIGLAGAASSSGLTVIDDVHIVTPDKPALLENKAVVIEAGRIQKIVDPDAVDDLHADLVIDGGGGYLTPGLIDAHVHHRDDTDYLNYLAHGVTTVIGLGQGRNGPELLRIRAAIKAGDLVGPRIYTTAQTVANHIRIEEPAEARRYVRQLASDGYDLVKVYNNIPQPVFDAVVETANETGLSVFGHLPRNFPVEYSLSHGLDVVAHGEEFYFAYFGGPRDQQLDDFDGSKLPDLEQAKTVIDLMVEHDVALIPNLIFSFVIQKFWEDEAATLANPELRYFSSGQRRSWREGNGARRDRIDKRMLRERIKYGLVHELTRRAHAAGVLLVTGTDAPVQGVIPGAALHGEMRELVKAGLSYAEALAAATKNGGQLVRKYVDDKARIGMIVPGYEADLVLVGDNPLDDIRNMAKIGGVMSDGAWLNGVELDELRNALAEKYTAP